VLLLFGRDPARPHSPYWFTIGGGIDAGESAPDAAARELREETGIRIETSELLGPIYRAAHSYSYDGVDYIADSTFFAVAVDRPTVTRDGLDDDEAANILEARWWAVDDLAGAPTLPGLSLSAIADAAVAAVTAGP
jgi:8-oxo-dGTP pyrophosphatase MutT (NUDIX family)